LYTEIIDARDWRSDELGIRGDIDPLADGDKARSNRSRIGAWRRT
jgi:hypothetical protein